MRRSSATMLVDSGGDLTELKRHGGWKSSQVAEGYIENSIENKLTVSQKICNMSKAVENLHRFPNKIFHCHCQAPVVLDLHQERYQT